MRNYGLNKRWHFNMTGNIALQTEDGSDVGWIGKVEGDKTILKIVKGFEKGVLKRRPKWQII